MASPSLLPSSNSCATTPVSGSQPRLPSCTHISGPRSPPALRAGLFLLLTCRPAPVWGDSRAGELRSSFRGPSLGWFCRQAGNDCQWWVNVHCLLLSHPLSIGLQVPTTAGSLWVYPLVLFQGPALPCPARPREKGAPCWCIWVLMFGLSSVTFGLEVEFWRGSTFPGMGVTVNDASVT